MLTLNVSSFAPGIPKDVAGCTLEGKYNGDEGKLYRNKSGLCFCKGRFVGG